MLLSKLSKTQSNSNPKTTWSNREFALITKYKQRVKDIEQINLEDKITNREVNDLDFYAITSKEDLPKYLQKMLFQTIHSKENVNKVIKIFKKEKETMDEKIIRKKLKENGKILYLSEIYQNLGEPNEFNKGMSLQVHKHMESFGGDLEEWQKNKSTAASRLLNMKKNNHSPRLKQSRIIDEKHSQLQRRGAKGNVNYFKQGSNYKKQIQRQLQIIYFTHSNEPKQINRYSLIENSSKLIKHELDQKRIQVQDSIKSKLKILNETRIEHHNLYEEKNCLIQQERQINQQVNTKQPYMFNLNSNLLFTTNSFNGTNNRYDKSTDIKAQKRLQIEQNQMKIVKNKRLIQSLQNGIQTSEEQLRSIMLGELFFYKTSLKIGMDCRDNGLGWILKKLRQVAGTQNIQLNMVSLGNSNNHKQYQYQFPTYLEKKSKDFLILKTQWEDQLDNLMEQKRKFVNQIGQSSSINSGFDGNKQETFIRMNYSPGAGCQTPKNIDKIMQDDVNCSDVPKKYRRSLRKITILNQQYAQNHSLIEFKKRPIGKAVEFSSHIESLSGKKLYEAISQKIKFFDFSSKSKKDKILSAKNSKLLEYQSLLNSIKEIHIKIQDLDISHENHLVNHYKEDNREVFFQQAAACFGYKKAYSMIIKHFSWKTGKQTVQI